MLRTARFVLPAVSVFLLAVCVGTARAAHRPAIANPLPAREVCLAVGSVSGTANECSDEAIQDAFDALESTCERPHRSNFYLVCNSDGGVSVLWIACDIW